MSNTTAPEQSQKEWSPPPKGYLVKESIDGPKRPDAPTISLVLNTIGALGIAGGLFTLPNSFEIGLAVAISALILIGFSAAISRLDAIEQHLRSERAANEQARGK